MFLFYWRGQVLHFTHGKTRYSVNHAGREQSNWMVFTFKMLLDKVRHPSTATAVIPLLLNLKCIFLLKHALLQHY